VRNLLLILRWSSAYGPYKKAARDYRRGGRDSMSYRRFVDSPDYLRHYRLAVELGTVYLCALYEAYFLLKEGHDFSEAHKRRFLPVVRGAVLLCPLETHLLEKARNALSNRKSMCPAIDSEIWPQLRAAPFHTHREIFNTTTADQAVQL
jgi:hypothetical protein